MNIAIIGSNGKNAKAWTEAFLNAGCSVRNLVRKPESLPARRGVSYAYLDLDLPSSYGAALKDAEILGLITPGGQKQVEQETGLIEAAARAGINRILKVSVLGAEIPRPISGFARSAAAVEEVLRQADVPHAILRPNFFMQQMLNQRASIEGGVYAEPTGSMAISYIDVRDIADVAVAAASGKLDGEAVALTGPDPLTGEQLVAALSEATGKPVRFVSPDLESFRAALSSYGMPEWDADALVDLFRAVQDGKAGHVTEVSGEVERITGKKSRSFSDFARQEFALG